MQVFAFGDVHGCCSRLAQLLQEADILDRTGHWKAKDTEVIGVGDYIDRGPEVAGVIDLLVRLQAEAPPHNSKMVCLRGNHEQVMLDAAGGDLDNLYFWQELGGGETLRSYGTTMAEYANNPQKVIPAKHWSFITTLPLTHRVADSLFVHAGVDLQRPFEQQDAHTLMEIRHWWHGQPEWIERRCGAKRVVFGHTPHKEVTPYLQGRAIAIDTGAVYGGKLSLIEVNSDGWRLVGQA